MGSTIQLTSNIYNYRLVAVKLDANRLYSMMVVPSNVSTNLAWGGLFSQSDGSILLQGGTAVIQDNGNALLHEHAWSMTIDQETGITGPDTSRLRIESLYVLYPLI